MQVYQETVDAAGRLHVPVKKPRTAARSVYRSNAGEDGQPVAEYYRLNIYVPLIDSVLQHLRDRFGPAQQKTLHLSALIPAHLGSFSDIRPAVAMYETFLETDQIATEFLLWKEQWKCPLQRKTINSAILALQNCSPVTLPNVNILLHILATLPVTTAQPERVFSKVEKTASAARASMSEDRLEALVLIQTHRDKTPSIDAVIDSFAANTTSSSRRFVL